MPSSRVLPGGQLSERTSTNDPRGASPRDAPGLALLCVDLGKSLPFGRRAAVFWGEHTTRVTSGWEHSVPLEIKFFSFFFFFYLKAHMNFKTFTCSSLYVTSISAFPLGTVIFLSFPKVLWDVQREKPGVRVLLDYWAKNSNDKAEKLFFWS